MSTAKTFQLTASDEAMQYIATAVLTRLLADRSAKRVPGEEYDKFLTEQIAAGHEAVAALNCTSGPTREDEALSAPPGIAAFILAMCDHTNGTMIGPDVTEKLQAVYAWLRIETRRTV